MALTCLVQLVDRNSIQLELPGGRVLYLTRRTFSEVTSEELAWVKEHHPLLKLRDHKREQVLSSKTRRILAQAQERLERARKPPEKKRTRKRKKA